ncbi:MAG: leucine-rich repeat protein [Clostridium sp.]|nr:leucine-rich repeat protein [Clostridium sp.]
MKIKKILSLVLVTVILIQTLFSVTTFATADNGTYKNFKYTVTDENLVVISKYIGNESSVNIPESINNYPVTEIGDSAFKGNFSIKNVEIPDGVKNIGDYAFNDCTALESITIPESVEKIGKSAFFYCTRLENVNVSDGIETIGDGAFFGCYSLKSFRITESVNSVGEYAFAKCRELKSVTIENGIKSINNQMFADCTSLNEIVLPNSIESIGRRAFLNCESLQNFELPDSVNTIADYAFSGCSSIKNLSISASKIGDYAFYFCSTLGRVRFSDNLEVIGDEAFEGTDLSEVSIPSAVYDIGEKAFATNKIKKINVDENNQHYTSIDGVLFNKSETEIIDYPNYAEVDFYAIPQSVTSIGEYAFAKDIPSLKNIIIPDTVTKIGNSAFADLCGLEYINIPNSVTEIGDNAFNGCMDLTSITIPYSVTEIGDSAFKYCSSLNSISLTEGLDSIGDYAFSGDYSLSNVTLPNSLKDISPTAFLNCENFCEYRINDNNPYFSLADGVLYSKDKTEIISYPYGKKGSEYSVLQGTKAIGDYAIFGHELYSVYIPQSVEKIGKNSFGFTRELSSDNFSIKTDFMVYGAIGSTAEKYCVENDLAFFTGKPSQNIEVVSLNAGDNVTFCIENANAENVVYSTSDKSIADVDSNGKITANSKGTTYIIASVGTMNFICKVNVNNGVAQKAGYTYIGFDTSTYTPMTKQAYQDWEDKYYSFNEPNPFIRLDNPAIYCYTTSEYIQIMSILVGGSYLDSTIKQMGEDYHQYETIADNLSMELNRYNPDKDMLLFSGTNDVSSITGKTSSLKDMKDAIGKSYVDSGVVSTSLDHGVADHFGDGIYHTVLEIYAPKSEINGAYISKMSDFELEFEYLLDKNLKYQVIDAGVRNVTFTGYIAGEPTTRVERYMKLRIVDSSKPDKPDKPDKPGKTDPPTSPKEPSKSDTEKTNPTEQTTPVATGDNALTYCVVALLMFVIISVCIYTKRNKNSGNS